MISARHWRERRNFGLALIFWVWLASFVFGFAASDAFHTASCPEQLALRAARDGGPTIAPASAAHAFALDLDCPTCLLQLGAQGILIIALLLVAPFAVAFIYADSFSAYVSARALSYSARGPPVSII